MSDFLTLGIDIGSTTAKIVLAEDDNILYSCYERHFSMVRQKTLDIVKRLADYVGSRPIKVAISGSAGLGLAKAAGIPFVQEVFATGETIKRLIPDAGTVIELGGEDAKILFFKGGIDERMNGTCAGGTGAFIDQMATLMNLSGDEMDRLSLEYDRIYPIASRCGVFAKSDIQPLLNQGASKANIAASIYRAVVNQTIAGLAQGRKILSKVVFLGGPLYYCRGLREAFVETLKLSKEDAVFPEYGRLAVAIGASIYAQSQNATFAYDDLCKALEAATTEKVETAHLHPLFENNEQFEEFSARHAKATVEEADISTYTGNAFLGIDCGSTTTKLVLISEECQILYSYYKSNRGNPVEIVRQQLEELYKLCEDRVRIVGSTVTGYGEELIKHAFHVDFGVVETIAHYTAAKYFNPKVDFILDIGGQDIKCFKIKNGAIDSIMLNEACSSGCGSFIETFARSMGYEIADFAKLGLFSKYPVDLGSRCTVFMNSSVKQAQKDGASVNDISAGLSMSVVKNAIYKVIRAGSASELGENIVVQGGTFLNDAILRSFELELGHEVVRPAIAGLMGAYGAALYAMANTRGTSTIITQQDLASFVHTSKAASCKGCTNNCRLTINTFANNERYISGNKCEKGAGLKKSAEDLRLPNIYEYKRAKLEAFKPIESPRRPKVGLPLSLGMYETLPFWHAIFSSLGFEAVVSGFSTRKIYAKGQYSIPSDTACYPAKIMHGHLETLIEMGVDSIFYPGLTYNFDEGKSDNHYNCPVVAYYSELLASNMDSLKSVKFMYPYLNINDEKELSKEFYTYITEFYPDVTKKEVDAAIKEGYKAYADWMEDIRKAGKEAVEYARENGKKIMILAGRPYHVDPEIGHGIDKLASSLGFAVVSEDSVSELTDPVKTLVLNQWTYHARLYNAAKYATEHSDTQLVQLVSFGCGIDAITTDEVRMILEDKGKLYTQIKIDEITNLGAVNIRLRSLLGAIEAQKGGS